MNGLSNDGLQVYRRHRFAQALRISDNAKNTEKFEEEGKLNGIEIHKLNSG
jgi:hypothetical protein